MSALELKVEAKKDDKTLNELCDNISVYYSYI